MFQELSVHDNIVYAYHVDCEERRLTLFTLREDRYGREFADVIFSDVIAHHFEHALQGNILFGIEEVDVTSLVQRNDSLLTHSWRYGWPPVDYRGDLAVLATALSVSGVRAFEISSSYGLSGWVLASDCRRVRRDHRANNP